MGGGLPASDLRMTLEPRCEFNRCSQISPGTISNRISMRKCIPMLKQPSCIQSIHKIKTSLFYDLLLLPSILLALFLRSSSGPGSLGLLCI